MEELKKKIIDLINDIKEVKRKTNEEKAESVFGEVTSNKEIKQNVEELKKAIDGKIREIVQKKEEILGDLEEKQSIIKAAMQLDRAEKEHMENILKEEQMDLKKRIDSVSQTIANYEKRGLAEDKISHNYYILLDNRNKWEEEYKSNELELESLQVKNGKDIENFIEQLINDVTYLNMETVDNTSLLEFVGLDKKINEKEEKKDKEFKQNEERVATDNVNKIPEKEDIKNPNTEENSKNNSFEVNKIQMPKINEKTYNIKAAPEYQKVDFELETREPKNEEIKKLYLSAKDEYIGMMENNKADGWELSRIIRNSKFLRKEIAIRARRFGFEEEDVIKIKRNASPMVSTVLVELKDEDALKKYFLAITMKTQVPFKLEYDLENSNLSEEEFKFVNKYAKMDSRLPGVVVRGAKYNIFEKIRFLFSPNKALKAGTIENKDEKDEKMMKQLVEDRKNAKQKAFRENIMVKTNLKNTKKQIQDEKYEKTTRLIKDDIDNTITRDNLMKQAQADEKEHMEDR